MPHIKNTYRYKNIVEVERVHSGRFGKRPDRGDRKKPTPEEMQKINERNAIKKLRRKIYANFEPGDLFLTLTYRREERPTAEEAKRELRRFFGRLRTEYKKRGESLRYIIVTEYTNKAIHHHLILNDLPEGNGAKIISRQWTKGATHCKFLYEDGQYELLASYLVKETGKHFRETGNEMKCRYSCSRNLVDPKKETKILKNDDWPEEPRIPKGYALDKQSLWNGINKMGYRYQYYRLVRIAPVQQSEKSIVNTMQEGDLKKRRKRNGNPK